MVTLGTDKKMLQKITLIVIAALTLISLVLLLIIIAMSVGDKPGVNDDEDLDIKLEFIDGNATDAQLSSGSLILANKNTPYTAPSDLSVVNIAEFRDRATGRDIDPSLPYPYVSANKYNFYMAADAIESMHNMLMDMKDATKCTGISVSAAYGKSDYPADKDLHTGYTIVLMVDLEEDTTRVNPYFTDESNEDLNKWMTENAHKYGFVTRYPDDKAEITGVSDYTYAYRYVGAAHATIMKEKGLCLEEYLDYLKKNSSDKDPITLKGADNANYVVYYVECADSEAVIKLPVESDEYTYTVSGTNCGGVVITVKVK
jgi:D-alanyl-D-alanine carboxypeptidase